MADGSPSLPAALARRQDPGRRFRTGDAMRTYVAEIDGRAIVAFRAENDQDGQRIVFNEMNGGRQLGLNSDDAFDTKGRVLWDGEAPITCRPASSEEHDRWFKGSHAELEDGQADREYVFLVPVLMSEAMVRIFFSSASQYYVAGRFGLFAWLNPVAGNLMHHAIEMYLKGALLKAKTKTLKELKDFVHSLPESWGAFKAQVNDPGLNRFDEVVDEIHKYEELRHPDRYPPVRNSMFDVVRWTPRAVADVEVPNYKLRLPVVDELIAAILAAASHNLPDFITAEAKEYLVRDNKEAALTKGVGSAREERARVNRCGETDPMPQELDLHFIASQCERLLAEVAAMRHDIAVLTAITRRFEDTQVAVLRPTGVQAPNGDVD
jgi:hypothetical protein